MCERARGQGWLRTVLGERGVGGVGWGAGPAGRRTVAIKCRINTRRQSLTTSNSQWQANTRWTIAAGPCPTRPHPCRPLTFLLARLAVWGIPSGYSGGHMPAPRGGPGGSGQGRWHAGRGARRRPARLQRLGAPWRCCHCCPHRPLVRRGSMGGPRMRPPRPPPRPAASVPAAAAPALPLPAATSRSLRLSSSRPHPQNWAPKPLIRRNCSAVMISRPPKKSCRQAKAADDQQIPRKVLLAGQGGR